ncbi:hypothetical protein PVAND_008969 [Polypedilum vanderplanki]|uniref:Vacuolar protein sorting-associated protein 11 homolog n=1 Tax=Polypedilum vanderplanki TaxID=319348 RepID=A0A9J6CB84_POLVA|nr:hypothetical protein PVAND_008969 [Polypedilum vanderplanki]
MLEWRKFDFFDLKPIVDEDAFSSVLSESDFVTSTSGNNQIIIGDSKGFVHVFPKNFRDSYTFKAHNCITHCELSFQNNLLVTLGNDEFTDSLPEFKVWNLNKLIKSIPACVRTVKTNLQRATALGVSENGQHMAIGFERGNITVYKGDIARDKTKSVKNITFGTASIKGIEFKQVGKITHMFVCSDSGVYLYTMHSRDKELKNVLDTSSANMVMTCKWLQTAANSEGYFMVGRDDAIYCYTTEGRAPCYAFDGRKVLIRWFRNHLLMVTCPIMENPLQTKPHTLTVIDVINRFIVFTTQVETVSSVFVEYGTCYVLTKNKLMYHLDEKDLQSKLNSLYKKNMYDTAVKIAKNNQYDAEGLSNIFKQYGDHLYNKGNFASAVEQYIKTIGYLEPSYVIRRFLDSRHTQFLTDYLQHIHKEGKASTDHTTLLLNCFTRLDRIDELKTFLENYKQNHFDIDVAINVCRKSCIEQALDLAKFNNKYDHAISIMIEDLKHYDNAVEYLSKLSYDDAERNIMKYGNLLMDYVPHKLITLLKKLCTDYIAKKCDESSRKDHSEDNDIFTLGYRNGGFLDEREQATPEDFIHLFNDSKQMIDYIEYLIRNLPTCSNFLYNSLIEHYLTLWKMSDNPSSERTGLEQRLVELIKNFNQFYDDNHVLVLCKTYEFWLGAMLIYEEKKLYNLIVRHYLNTKDFGSLYGLCKRLGPTDSSIWLATLNGLKSSNQVPSSFLQEILQVIATEKLQSPLQVLNILTSIDNGPNLSTVRSYFMSSFQKEDEIIKKDREAAEKYHNETEELKNNIETMNRKPIEFRGSLCDACHQPLNFPSLFFLCKHSFHQDCIRSFSETEKDCMVCRKKNTQLLDTMHIQNESRNKNHIFQEEIEKSHEPFGVVAEYFSRSLFNKIVLLSDDDDENREKFDDIKLSRKPQQKQYETKPLPNTSEGKIRLEETLGTNVQHKPQLSEGRLRLQEQSYNKSKPIERFATQSKPQQQQSIRKKQEVKVNYPISSNPFDDDDDDIKNENYNEALNPFADEDEVIDAVESVKTPISTNPFGDEDDE